MAEASSGMHRSCVCPWWLMYVFNRRVRALLQPTAPVVASLVGPGASCLDVGCGMGYFTVRLAQLVGPTGHITAVDIQPRMLEGAARWARREGVTDHISFRLSRDPQWVLPEHYDFILAFWMLHEVPDRKGLLDTLRRVLKRGGQCLLVEPRLHVGEGRWKQSLAAAEAVGFHSREPRDVRFSRAALLQ